MGSRIYSDYFGIPENAFSITPDPRFLFMSERHCEALAHLLYGVVESGCFILLTGEVGTGKTTVCRTLLEQLPENVDVALLLSPPKTWQELLLSIADELHVPINNRDASQHELVYVLTRRLLENYGQGRRTVVIIDEAQNIPPDVLEQVRLLTNLETHTDKLLHVFLVGQPELRDLLRKPSLRQVAQRITARYHLEPLSAAETQDYVSHRLNVVGCRQGLFSTEAFRTIYQESKGIPRVINILCDRALLGAFANDQSQVTPKQIRLAAHQWRGEQPPHPFWSHYRLSAVLAAMGVLGAAAMGFEYMDGWQIGIPTAAAKTAQAAPAQSATGEPYQLQKPAERRSLDPTQASEAAQTDVGKTSAVSTPAEIKPVQPETQITSEKAEPSEDTDANKAQPLPPGIHAIGPGSPPHAIRWLRHELDRIEGTVSSEDSPLFDGQLRERIMALQRRSGLVVDGVAGPHTLNYMRMFYGTAVPFQADSLLDGELQSRT